MRNFLLTALLAVLFLGGLGGCELINPEEEPAAFLHIAKPTFTAGGPFGSDAHEIMSGWVYYNGRLIGVFDLPADLPVLHKGNTKVTVEAGVVVDGQRATRTNYPMYDSFEDSVFLEPGVTQTITPSFTYENFVQQKLYRDFESTDQDPFEANSPYQLQRVAINDGDSLHFPDGGDYVGLVQGFADTTEIIQLVSNISDMSLSQGGRPVFAEFNIRTNRVVEVGLLVTRNGNSEGVKAELKVLPTGGAWKKFYVNLENEVNANYNLGGNPTYKLIFRASPAGAGRPYIALDNIRLIQFP